MLISRLQCTAGSSISMACPARHSFSPTNSLSIALDLNTISTRCGASRDSCLQLASVISIVIRADASSSRRELFKSLLVEIVEPTVGIPESLFNHRYSLFVRLSNVPRFVFSSCRLIEVSSFFQLVKISCRHYRFDSIRYLCKLLQSMSPCQLSR